MNFKLFDKEQDKKILKWVAIGVVIVAALIIIIEQAIFLAGYYDVYYSYFQGSSAEEQEYKYSDCNVAVIKLHGDLYVDAIPDKDEVSSSAIVEAIEKADEDNNIKAIILDINSAGGGPIAGEEVANALNWSSKPTVAIIRQSGYSAAYLAATGADVIFASKNSDVGSIGVTMSYLDNVRKNEKEGLTYNSLSSGKFKDTSDPDKPLTYEEKQLLMRDIKIVHENFVEAVAENRGMGIEQVRQLADGSSMMGEMALEKGLIDHIGGLYEAKGYLEAEQLGEPAVICGE